MRRTFVLALTLALMALLVDFMLSHRARADYDGPTTPEIRAWFESLKQPDVPLVSCCGDADAVYADEWEAHADGSLTVTVTDGRGHVPDGTKIDVPARKLKYDAGNPTGHAVLFLSIEAHLVFCFVMGGGI